MPPPKNMSLEALPAELLAQVLKRLDPESLSTCNGLNKLFHSQPSIVEQALRQVAIDEGFDVPETLPSACADWTQALLFLAVLRRESGRALVSGGTCHSAFVDASGTLLMSGNDAHQHPHSIVRPPPLLGRINKNEHIEEIDQPIQGHQPIPRPMPGLEDVRVRSVASAAYSVFVLSVEGAAFSWGDGSQCHLGHGDKERVSQPKQIEALSNACGLSVSARTAFVITTDGALWSWGDPGADGVLGHGSQEVVELLPRRIQALAGKYMCAVSAGEKFTLAVCAQKGECFSWGRVKGKSCGLPVRIPELCGERVISVAASDSSCCAITWQGELWWCGDLGESHLHLRQFDLVKYTLLDNHRVVAVTFGTNQCLALTAEGVVFSWLHNRHPDQANGFYDPDASDDDDYLQFLRERADKFNLLGRCGDPDCHPQSDRFQPQPIEVLVGQRICSIAAAETHSIAAGWVHNAKALCNQTVAVVVNPQREDVHVSHVAVANERACWSWGINGDASDYDLDLDNSRLGRGHFLEDPDESTPGRVLMGLDASRATVPY